MRQIDIRNDAITFARTNKLKIANRLTDVEVLSPDPMPVSVFMAGSPGAGKTEFSQRLVETFGKRKPKALRIDGDELREYFPDYTGDNSKLFQGAISILVDKIHDLALKKNQNFILDGTFSQQDKAVENIERSLKKKRLIFVFYVYQDPLVAWKFTQKRELVEGRNIPKSAFIQQFVSARKTVSHVRKKYGEEVVMYLVEKNYEKNTVNQLTEIEPGDEIDQYLPRVYTDSALRKLLL